VCSVANFDKRTADGGTMKKTALICFLIISFSGISEAAEVCVIKMTCTHGACPSPVIGYAITAETSRTQQATYDASMILGGAFPLWDGSCYRLTNWDIFSYYCQSGIWYFEFYTGGSAFVGGVWDVYCGEDGDSDGIPDYMDNCPDIPNGPGLGTCVPGSSEAGAICQSNADCGGDLCSKTQEDTDNDGIGNVCDSTPASTTTTVIPTTTTIYSSTTTTAQAAVCPGLLPDTEQTACYDTTQEIACPEPDEPFYGQDAAYTNPPSYTKLAANGSSLHDSATSWATVRDNVTGLIWEEKHTMNSAVNYNDPNDADNTYTWYDGSTGTTLNGRDTQDFINALNARNYGGYNDWRLPTVKELANLVDTNRPMSAPKINTIYFSNTQLGDYWSATSSSNGAWSVYFYYGYASNYDTGYGYYARAVRGGESSNNFIDNKDGTASDTGTGLMWAQAPPAELFTWREALAYCENFTLAGYHDWRLPNRNELQSLVDYGRRNPSIDTAFFPDTVPSYYWSSTTVGYDPSSTWGVEFANGNVADGFKTYFSGVRYGYGYLRPVRGNLCGSLCDTDGDTVCNDVDNCIDTYNPGQQDADGDGIGDACETATIITLSSLAAIPKGGKVILQWSTESEIDNAGFNLYRAAAENGDYVKINAALIPAQGSATQGAAYEFIDTNIKNRKTYWYKLKDVDLNGTATVHGPVSAMPRLIYGQRR
jgi:hypothetical protein